MKPVRCFVAIELPDEIREGLVQVQHRLSALGVRARWVAAQAMHLTLKFLGELDPAAFDRAVEALAPPIATGGPIRLKGVGLGGFPSANRARVLWAGLDGDVAALARAALEVEARVEPLGVPREHRPFRPHLTLGRAKRGSAITGLERALDTVGDWKGSGFQAQSLTLFESRLRAQGPTYISRLSIPLV